MGKHTYEAWTGVTALDSVFGGFASRYRDEPSVPVSYTHLFDGIDTPPRGMEDVSKIPALVSELARRGYSEEDLEKILGGNVLRVMRQVEQVAHQTQGAQ